MNDTICGVSTSLGIGAISIIRISGDLSIKKVNEIFKGKDLTNVKSHTIHYGYIIYNEEIIDEVLVSIMKSPKTFTKEDIVEINCHGGISTTNKVLEILIETGVRLAEPGEFTKRAFLNGRIDLIEAESVMDLINSKTESSRKLAISGLNGRPSKMIKALREELIKIISNIEVNIDYPEYRDIEVINQKDIKTFINSFIKELNRIIKEYETTKIVKDGIKTAIIGRPNVGKSSILNQLLDEEKAIVTNIAGTTRDIIEGEIILNGIKLSLIDTAGIRETTDIIEKIGVEKTKKELENADLVLIVLNYNEPLTDEDLNIIKETKQKHIIVINKSDLPKQIDLSKIKNEENIIYTNTIKDDGIESLKEKIITIFNLGEIKQKDYNSLTNARQIGIIKECLNSIKNIKQNISKNPIDLIEIDLKNIYEKLGEIIGESFQDDILDNLFKNFCIGK